LAAWLDDFATICCKTLRAGNVLTKTVRNRSITGFKKGLSARLARGVMPIVEQAHRKKTQAVEKSVAVPTKAIIDRYKKKKKRYQLFESVSFECLVDS
jgi:hypothetical protein